MAQREEKRYVHPIDVGRRGGDRSGFWPPSETVTVRTQSARVTVEQGEDGQTAVTIAGLRRGPSGPAEGEKIHEFFSADGEWIFGEG